MTQTNTMKDHTRWDGAKITAGGFHAVDCPCEGCKVLAKQAQYTPGPWNVSRWAIGMTGAHISISGGKIIAHTSGASAVPTEQDTANARLIAAAPDLLAVVKDLAVFSYTECQPQVALQILVRIKRQARLAIAKAEGRAQ